MNVSYPLSTSAAIALERALRRYARRQRWKRAILRWITFGLSARWR